MPANSNVVNVLDVIAHQFRSDHCLLGNWDITGSRRHDDNDSLALLLSITFENDGACQRTILRVVFDGGDRVVLFLSGSGSENVAAHGPQGGLKIPATCCAVLPWEKITSGIPCRRAR